LEAKLSISAPCSKQRQERILKNDFQKEEKLTQNTVKHIQEAVINFTKNPANIQEQKLNHKNAG